MSVKLNLNIPASEKGLWEDVIIYKVRNNFSTINDAVVSLLKLALQRVKK